MVENIVRKADVGIDVEQFGFMNVLHWPLVPVPTEAEEKNKKKLKAIR